MWTSIYIANNRKQAESLKKLLSDEGILANIRPVGLAATTGDGMYEIQVLESEVDEAQTIICQGVTRQLKFEDGGYLCSGKYGY